VRPVRLLSRCFSLSSDLQRKDALQNEKWKEEFHAEMERQARQSGLLGNGVPRKAITPPDLGKVQEEQHRFDEALDAEMNSLIQVCCLFSLSVLLLNVCCRV
jgi:hypothetical protein